VLKRLQTWVKCREVHLIISKDGLNHIVSNNYERKKNKVINKSN